MTGRNLFCHFFKLLFPCSCNLVSFTLQIIITLLIQHLDQHNLGVLGMHESIILRGLPCTLEGYPLP